MSAFETSLETINSKYNTVVEGFRSGKTLDLDFRRGQIRNLYYTLLDNEDKLKKALTQDLHRHPSETEMLELNGVFNEAIIAIRSLDAWAADIDLGTSDLKVSITKPQVRKTPYGVVLIQSPWNYPYLLTVAPIISALAAGNVIVLKPTEVAPASTLLLTDLLERALDPSVFQVVLGSVAESTALLDLKWDKIMLTGSSPVGKVVAKAAANHLTPVILELGGKSPVIVSRKANIQVAAKRIAWGKLVNAGQTCIAPDYAIVDEQIKDALIIELKKAIKSIYPNLTANSDDYSHIVSSRHFDRAVDLVSKTKGKVWHHGKADSVTRFFPPTIVSDVELDDILMSDELFIPVLPIISVNDVERDAPELIRKHDHPLSLYVFTQDAKQADRILATTRSGSAMINDCVYQGGSTIVPFGGVGSSGVGRYHGKYGFDEFSYDRPVLNQPLWAEPIISSRYAPYKPLNSKMLRFIDRPWIVPFSRTGPVRGSLINRLWPSRWKIIAILLLILYLKKGT